ncbi:MAG: PASTA domain-containing protein [Oscillospiraceae bacterium]|nr:PASTA domain-containing protein [Oscillospiraceae bacterium]
MLPIASKWKGRDEMAGKGKKEYIRLRGDSGQHRRIIAIAIFLGIVAFLPVAYRLYDLMVRQYDYYAELALRNQTRSTSVSADRGTIYDRNMNILACAVSVENVYLDPHELKQSKADIEEISRVLGEILREDPQWIQQQAADRKMRYKQIGAKIPEETAAQIRAYINENNISGIHLEPDTKRYYPYGSLAAQVIGFTNASNTGSEGIEAAYNSFLEGSTGRVITTKGNNEMDMPFSYESYVSSRKGNDVILTVDTTVQACLEKNLEEAIAKYDVQNGAFGIVMNVNTGEILAMATLGSYDPNNYTQISDSQEAARIEELKQAYLTQPEGTETYENGKKAYQEALTAAQLKQWRNRCISDGYEPGSTFKVMTMAAALDSGAIDLNTGFHCSGAEQIPGRAQRLHCWRSSGHGSEQTPQALQNSCNIAFAHIALKMGGETFYRYVKSFGILEKTGIDLAGESKGVFFSEPIVTDTDKWGTASLTSGSFGQTFKITPLQLVRGIAAVVNGGNLIEPYIVSEVVDQDGNTVLKQETTVTRRVISQETSDIMCKLMQSVVEEGTAKNASVSGYLIGGKTGTSEKIDVFDENGQRVLDKIVSFVGVAPMDNPEYIVLAALDTPSRQTGIYISGGVMAAPTVGAIFEDILPYLGVQRTFSPDEVAGQTLIMEDLTKLSVSQAQEQLKQSGLTGKVQGTGETVVAQIPAAGQSLPGGSEVLLYTDEIPENETVTVPDFSGLNRQQASDLAGSLGLYILVSGNDSVASNVVVTEQSEAPQTQVPVGTTIRLTFADTKAVD